MDFRKSPSPLGFSLVELLVVIAVMALLSTSAYLGIGRVKEGSMDRKVQADLSVIASAVERYRQQEGRYPVPGKEENQAKALLCFEKDGSYRHDCQGAAFMQGFVTKELLGESLKDIPLDPRTAAPYVYGVTLDGQRFQVAGLLMAGETQARVRGGSWGEVQASGGTEGSLIRAFDGPDFVMNEGKDLPYSPRPFSFAATVRNIKGAVTVEGEKLSEGGTVEPGQTIETQEDASAILYLPGGSITYLDPGTRLTLDEGSGIVTAEDGRPETKTGLKLEKGKVWNKVSRLMGASEFRVETTSAIAGVRGTEFGLEAEGSELILKSGIVSAFIKPQGQEDVPGFLWQTPLDQNKEALNDTGKYMSFTIPEEGEVMGEGQVIEDEGLIKELNGKYYNQPFTKRIIPLILGVNADPDQEGQDVLVFSLAEGTQKIHAVNKDDLEQIIHTWELNEIVFDWDQTLMKVDPTPAYDKGTVKFRFEDMEGNRSDTAKVALGLGKGMKVSPQMLYGTITLGTEVPKKMKEAEDQLLPQEGPSIVNAPQNMALSSQAQLLSASMPCDWTIEPASSGALVGNANDSDAVQYKPLNDSLQANALQANVANRFDNSSTEPVTVRCTNPNDPNQFDEKVITLNYGAFKSSDLSNYEYSYKAQGNVSWNIAKSTCAGLQEGGHSDWKLPEKAVYEGLNLNDEETNLCQFDGNVCTDLPGVSIFLLEEQQNQNSGHDFHPKINVISGIGKAIVQPMLGLRCVRN